MAFYSTCSLVVEVPANYSKKDDLVRFLESKFEGCRIKIEGSETKEIFAQSAEVSAKSRLSSLQVGKEWAPPGHPAPMESDAGPYLLRAANEAIEEFIEKSEKSE